MAIERDEHGHLVENINGIKVTYTDKGVIVGDGLEQILIRGKGLKVADAAQYVRGTYPDYYPFSAPHRHPEEDVYINFSLDPCFPPDDIPLDRLPRVIRELKKMVSETISVKTEFPSEVEDGDLVVWDLNKEQYVPATCSKQPRANVAAGLFFNGVADLDTGTVITSSTVTHEGWELEEGRKYYLDCANPGKLTTEDTGYFVGIAQGPHTLFLAPLADSVEDLITALEKGLEKEIADRIADVDAEEAARIAADEKEKQERIAADKAEAEAREAAIEQERRERIEADNAEAAARQQADADEARLRQEADAAEAAARVNMDNALGSRIDRLIQEFCTKVETCITGRNPDGTDAGLGGGIGDDIILADKGLSQDPYTGKLYVNMNHIIKYLGGLGTDGDGNVFVKPGEIIKPGGGLETGDGGNLVVKPGDIISSGGGLIVDGSGNLMFDADSLGEAAYLKLLQRLRLKQWLTGNYDLYVNASTGSDYIEDGRGTAAKPFATIQGAINFMCDNIDLSIYNTTIHVASGTYDSAWLRTFSGNGGSVTLQGTGKPTIRNNTGDNAINCSGGPWRVSGFNLIYQDKSSGYAAVVEASGNACNLTIDNCVMTMNRGSGKSGKIVECQDFGTVTLNNGNSYTASVTGTSNVMCFASYGGLISFGWTGTQTVSGNFGIVAEALGNNSTIQVVTATNGRLSGSATGTRFKVARHAELAMNGLGLNYFPGSADGIVESETYGLYT